MKCHLAVLVLLTLALPAAPADAQTWGLENHAYYEPVLAEPRGAQTTVLFPARADSFPYAVNDAAGLVWDISLGRELPIFGFSRSKGSESSTGVAPGAFGVGVWMPLSFHMVEDMGKDPSNPILNTDYRFGGLVKVQWGLRADQAFWSSAHIGAKFQFGHESTHIGDEFTLGALRAHRAEFVRVNVSYEYYDAAAAFEPNIGKDGRYQVKLRAGNIWLWRPADGWYSPELLQPYGLYIARSRRNHEPYVQFEFYSDPAARDSKFGLIVSVDVRNRTIYQYVAATNAAQTNPSEPTEWSTNVMVGLRQVRSGAGTLGKLTPTYYLRAYHGVNPNGQFRNQSAFTEFGFGVQFGF